MTDLEFDRFKDDLVAHEGRRCRADKHVVYDDATGEILKPGMTLVGQPTVGYGRNLVDRGLDEFEAAWLLDEDATQAVEDAADVVGAATWGSLDEVRQSVIANMAFNMGPKRLAGFVQMLAAVRAGDFKIAAVEMMDSKWATQVPKRAQTLARWMHTGVRL